MICVYKIVNITTNEIYVGSTIDFNKRSKEHFRMLLHNKHHSIKLQRSYNKHGIVNFKIEVIEQCTQENKQEKEQYYIDTLKPSYNISLSSICPMLGRKHSDETIIKFKSREVKSGKDHYNYGKTIPQEVIDKSIKSRIGLKRSEEFKKIQSDNAKRLNLGRFIKDSCKLKVIDDLGNIYESAKDAAIKNGVSCQTVCDILKGRHKQTRNKRSFKYYESV